ncbi:BirA family biotin operon repressor/biotin-[acetyl-CoA-carboxylase] ligase [Paenochrobactrum gallinarii]|uniref:biotin--[biotin carboxyl-carrier protein] ligase n=1 Tax=Paenochrobactrum gallinarii TaxID=643673 RepID=A0A841LQ22_9HYPH|nr:biotin--[acetyl-CoA-carboxylase] ligase [Paenochrobactrum gallinarii]MBB6260143.1 BirA family biotin operon repressor/biotin-[acetyl-CoA-carboxylase] ligase [Paenochrobactrum gallinarii]
MHFSLSPIALSQSYRLESFETIGSTNAVALERAAGGDQGKIWFVSKRQESGRGRRGRAWSTPEGNLASTLLLVEPFDLKNAATLGFVAGLALAEALDAVLTTHKPKNNLKECPHVTLKWPNDVFVNGAKLSGILLETVLLAQNRFGLAIGIGTNIVSHPTDLPYEATCLQKLGSDCDAETLFMALSDAWAINYQIWNHGLGLDAIRLKWLERAHQLGNPVSVMVEGKLVEGVFETIDSSCRLVICEGDGTRTTITAGDVYFGSVASVRKNT